MVVPFHGVLAVKDIIKDVGLPLPPAAAVRRPATARFRGRLVFVPGAEDGPDKREQLLNIIVELAGQADHAATRFAAGTLADTALHLRHERVTEVHRLVAAATRRQAVRRHAAAAVDLRVPRQAGSGFDHCTPQACHLSPNNNSS